jgi:Big-like domain-containing protein
MNEARGSRIEVRSVLILGLLTLAACAPKHASANHPPTVRARCEPCTVAPGGTVKLTAQAQDADGDRLDYHWTVAAGTLTVASESSTSWKAPMHEGPVPIAITVRDGHGGTASDVATIQVVQPR